MLCSRSGNRPSKTYEIAKRGSAARRMASGTTEVIPPKSWSALCEAICERAGKREVSVVSEGLAQRPISQVRMVHG